EVIVMERRAHISCSVGELIARSALAEVRIVGRPDVVVTGVSLDSRNVAAGDLFCCVPGSGADGHDFALDAVAHGATALLVQREIHGVDDSVSQIVVPHVRLAMGPVSSEFYGRPSTRMCVVGVTGTNGKTTTTAMLASIFSTAGHRTNVLGTLTGSRTTPEAPDLQQFFANSLADDVVYVAMEVSSHALDQHRVDGTRFGAVVFTNLGRDHLDYHETMERYFAAKARLFIDDFAEKAVVNADDVHGRLLIDSRAGETSTYSRQDIDNVRVSAESVSFSWQGITIDVPIGGDFNVDNALAACVTARELGFSLEQIREGLASLKTVRGRFESILNTLDVHVIVDYAHTPEALARRLTAVTTEQGKRLIVVFGCGGDRDAGKRPVMGAIAAAHADVVVVTSDNPRHEDAAAIVDDIIGGIDDVARRKVTRIVDRRSAIEHAITIAEPGDIVVIAGRGHESKQEVAGEMRDFDDASVAREVLQGLVKPA
ncbi:MAG: UDP-N-acetylmuramoyl-L-alanyl-D-glutamate--2,6-diaminopimelate ligase, partial [Actinomycetota bacterium]